MEVREYSPQQGAINLCACCIGILEHSEGLGKLASLDRRSKIWIVWGYGLFGGEDCREQYKQEHVFMTQLQWSMSF